MLQDVVWEEHGEVGEDQVPDTIIQVDPGGVAGDGHVSYPDPGPLYVAGGDHGDRHQHLVQVGLKAAGSSLHFLTWKFANPYPFVSRQIPTTQ